MDALAGIFSEGFRVFFEQPVLWVYLLGGYALGLVVGILPGLTPGMAIVLLLPLSITLPPVPALVIIMGIYMAGIFGGSITAVTINVPGTPAAMMTGLDGYEFMKKGKGSRALAQATFSSMLGGTLGTLLAMVVGVFFGYAALFFQTPDKFSLVLFSLAIIVFTQTEAVAKGLVMVLFGSFLSMIGVEATFSVPRFWFGQPELLNRVSLVSVIVGCFAISELLHQSRIPGWKVDEGLKRQNFSRRAMIPPLSDLKEVGIWAYLRATMIGLGIGILPGTGAATAAFISYGEAKRASRHPERFGKGTLEGIAAPETANNAVCGGALVPLLIFGIPGDGVVAVVYGHLLIHGVLPGPEMMSTDFSLSGPMFAALVLAAAVMIPSVLLIIGPLCLKIVQINRAFLYSLIGAVSLLAVYTVEQSIFQTALAIIIGLVAYFLRKNGYPVIALLMGFILFPMAEYYFFTGMQISGGNPIVFIQRPISVVFLLLIFVFYYFLLVRKKGNRGQEKNLGPSPGA